MKHTTNSAGTCDLCRSKVRDVEDMVERDLRLSLEQRKHNAAMTRRAVHNAYRDMGMTRRKDGGWE